MRIQGKFFIWASTAAVAVMLGFGGYVLYAQSIRGAAKFQNRINQVDRLFDAVTTEAIRAGDIEEVKQLCRIFLDDPILHRIQISDPAGNIWLAMDAAATGAPEPAGFNVHAFSVASEGAAVAHVEITYTHRFLRRQLRDSAVGMVGIILVMLLVLFLGYRSLSDAFSHQFDDILKAMRQVDGGDYSTRLALTGKDQFGQIGKYFNAMVASIEQSDRAEREYAGELEKKTRQLEAEIAAKEDTAEALRQSQKMEAVARLAGGVAHDFNNLLTSILGFSTMALNELGEDHPAAADIEEVVRSGERARDLTHKLLTLGRKQPMDRRLMDLNVVIKGVVQLLKRSIGEDIELVTEMDSSLGSVLADPGSMEQVLVNLAVNARDAMPAGGRLYITSADRNIDEAEAVRLGGDIQPGRYATIRVRDTGKGMSAPVRDRVFEPFFTTKSESKGTGLGLSTAYGIIHQCGGAIEVISELDKGAEFILYLPTEGEDSATVKVQLMEQPVGGTETVLLVEDEDSVRRLASRILSGLGYQVLEARYGAEGVTIAGQFSGPIDLILSDVVMPQLSGPDMVKQIAQHRNDFKVLYMSGFTQDRRLVDSRGHEAPLLRKPFNHDQLARAIRTVIEG